MTLVQAFLWALLSLLVSYPFSTWPWLLVRYFDGRPPQVDHRRVLPTMDGAPEDLGFTIHMPLSTDPVWSCRTILSHMLETWSEGLDGRQSAAKEVRKLFVLIQAENEYKIVCTFLDIFSPPLKKRHQSFAIWVLHFLNGRKSFKNWWFFAGAESRRSSSGSKLIMWRLIPNRWLSWAPASWSLPWWTRLGWDGLDMYWEDIQKLVWFFVWFL